MLFLNAGNLPGLDSTVSTSFHSVETVGNENYLPRYRHFSSKFNCKVHCEDINLFNWSPFSDMCDIPEKNGEAIKDISLIRSLRESN